MSIFVCFLLFLNMILINQEYNNCRSNFEYKIKSFTLLSKSTKSTFEIINFYSLLYVSIYKLVILVYITSISALGYV
jgi:hypothetical protein